jgi:hypothetical protein
MSERNDWPFGFGFVAVPGRLNRLERARDGMWIVHTWNLFIT